MRRAISSDVWASRFMAAAIVQRAIIVGLTAFLVLGQTAFVKLEVARVIAGGSAAALGHVWIHDIHHSCGAWRGCVLPVLPLP